MLDCNGCLVSWQIVCKKHTHLLIGLDDVSMVSASIMVVDDCIGSSKDCHADNCFLLQVLASFVAGCERLCLDSERIC